jgi:hypothetical protein
MFRPKKIKFLGRVGLIFNFNGQSNKFDSELLTGKYDLVVSNDDVFLITKQGEIKLEKVQKDIIFNKLQHELFRMGLRSKNIEND